MMVGHICTNLAYSTVFGQMFAALRDAGLFQRVAVPERDMGHVGKNTPDGIDVRWFMTLRKTDALFFFRKAQRTVPELQKEHFMENLTLLHAHTLFTDGSIAHALWKQTGVPYVVTVRYSDYAAIWKYEPHLHALGRRILRDAAAVVFLSKTIEEQVLLWMAPDERGKIAAKSHIIPNGIAEAWLDGTPRKAPGSPVRVGFSGLLNQRKRPLDALRAVHLAEKQSGRRFVFLAAGDGPLKESIREELGEGDQLEGHLEGMEAMKQFYRRCDMLLVPSSAETFGMVYLEAMSQGVPVLYTKGQGFDGQFPEGEVGYSVPCGNPQAQATIMLRLLHGAPERSARCIELAKQCVWETIAGRWMELYNGIQQ